MNSTEMTTKKEMNAEELRAIIREALNKLENAPNHLFTTSKHAIFIYELEKILRKA